MIIVEGPDGAGKSTLVKQLTEQLMVEVGERATADRSKLYTVTRRDTYTALGHAVSGGARAKVWDRLFFSELIYHDVVGRENEFSENECIFIKKLLRAIDCPIIACLPPWDTVVKNAHADEQMDGVLDNLEQIYLGYQRVFVGMDSQILWYDYTGEQAELAIEGLYKTQDEIVSVCLQYLHDREVREWR